MKYCNSCPKRPGCVKICERVEKYVNQDYVSLREIIIDRPFLDILFERSLEDQYAPLVVRHKKFLETIRPGISRLTKKQKKVLYLFFYHDMTISEVGRRLRISRPAASIRLKNALTILKSIQITKVEDDNIC